MSARFLIFGGAGFVGTRIALELGRLDIPVQVSRADVREASKLQSEITGFQPTHVINAAAVGVNPALVVDSPTLEAVNTTGAMRVQDACSRGQVKRLVHLGSCFEYGSYEPNISEDFALNPGTPYAVTKANGSTALLKHGPHVACETLVLRLFGVWGPGENPQRLVPQILNAAKTKTPLALTHGRQVRDFSFVDDIVADIVALALCPAVARVDVVNVGSGRGLSVLQFATDVARALDCISLLQPGTLPERPGEMARLVASTQKLSTLIQLKPRTSLESGLKQMA